VIPAFGYLSVVVILWAWRLLLPRFAKTKDKSE
jgi:hypothetical protein